MNRKEILEKLDTLQLPKNEFIVISGASLVLQEIIEETRDIDLTCSKEFYDNLNWDEKVGAAGIKIKYKEDIEIGNNFYDNKRIVFCNGYKIANLEHVLDVKKELNREKDKEIIKKLEKIIKKKED